MAGWLSRRGLQVRTTQSDKGCFFFNSTDLGEKCLLNLYPPRKERDDHTGHLHEASGSLKLERFTGGFQSDAFDSESLILSSIVGLGALGFIMPSSHGGFLECRAGTECYLSGRRITRIRLQK